MYWTSSSGLLELQITLKQAQSASHQGQCDYDVMELSKVPKIARQLAKLDLETVRDELRGYGAWDSVELSNHAQNLQRILWLACGDIVEEHLK